MTIPTTQMAQTPGTVAPDVDLGAEQGGNPWDWTVFVVVVLIALVYLGRRFLIRRRSGGCDGCGRTGNCNSRMPPPAP